MKTEASFFAISNGETCVALASAQDHKTIFDGDRGPNTGGMGAFTPVASLDAAMHARIMRTIVEPSFAAIAREGAPYRGVLFVGLMLTADGPKVIEYNVRFGDPECQAILAAMEGDLLPLLDAAARGATLPPVPPGAAAAVCVVLASGGYPEAYPTGLPIEGIVESERVPELMNGDAVEIVHAPRHRACAQRPPVRIEEVLVVEDDVRFGFRLEDWELLAEALRTHGVSQQVVKTVESPYGTRYAIQGPLESPDGRHPLVRTVWLVKKGQVAARLITAYPMKERDD